MSMSAQQGRSARPNASRAGAVSTFFYSSETRFGGFRLPHSLFHQLLPLLCFCPEHARAFNPIASSLSFQSFHSWPLSASQQSCTISQPQKLLHPVFAAIKCKHVLEIRCRLVIHCDCSEALMQQQRSLSPCHPCSHRLRPRCNLIHQHSFNCGKECVRNKGYC